jgi:hypothetical protein
VSLRRCLRVGRRWGEPVEDLGVVPDERYRMTRRDLLEGNADLLARAAEILAGETPRRLDAEVTRRTAAPSNHPTTTLDRTEGSITLEVSTDALTGLDVYVNQRPARSAVITDKEFTLSIPLPGTGPAVLRLEGFDADTLVAARTLPVDAAP